MAEDNGSENIVVLVHGTFAADAAWVRRDSPFCRILRQTLGSVRICPFRWSGRNSHTARLKAAKGLAGFIDDLLDSYPNAKIHVIAHSHGGNVALYALRDDRLRKVVAGVVFLGTPFVTVARRDISSTLKALQYAVPVGVSFPWIVALLLFLIYAAREFARSGPIVLLSIMSVALAGTIFFAGRWWLHFLGRRLPQILQARQHAIVDLLTLPGVADVPLYTVRARRDEAATYLRNVDRIADIPFRLWHPKGIAWLVAAVTVLLVGGYTFVALTPDETGFDDLWARLSGLSFFLLVVPLAGALILVLTALVLQGFMIVWSNILRGHQLGFGDRILQNWLVHVASTDRPPGSQVCRDSEAMVSGKGLRHSLLYQDPQVAESVARWLGNPIREDPS